jgi:hypothetical protein
MASKSRLFTLVVHPSHSDRTSSQLMQHRQLFPHCMWASQFTLNGPRSVTKKSSRSLLTGDSANQYPRPRVTSARADFSAPVKCPSVGIREDSLARLWLVKQVGTVGPGLTPGRPWDKSEPASGYYASSIPWGQVRWFSRPGCKVLNGRLVLSVRVKCWVQTRVHLEGHTCNHASH